MTVSTSVHSNAFNFMSFLSNGVDPRTGQYTVSISLPEVKANALQGPQLPLSLTYNPLNTQDSGFGLGWNLQLSQIDLGNLVVALSSGESLKITGSDPGSDRLLMKEQKIDNFHLHGLGADRYRLVHKSGLVEWLRRQGNVALPERLQAETGHGLNLHYTAFGGAALLSAVHDDSGQQLLGISRSNDEVEILLNPGAGPGDQALARFVMRLSGSDRRVSQISLPTDNQASWRFDYRQVRDLLCMSTVHTPVGAREEILYQDNGHQFPAGSGRAALPRVTRHTTYPGFGQATVDVVYSYDDQGRNFLGAGLPINWSDDGLDNLYKHIGAYEYQSSESLFVEGRALRTIQRTFNRFHLLSRESTVQSGTEQRVETRYPFQEGVPFEQQPRQCQLPSEVKTTWTLTAEPGRLRSETALSDYDDFGNLIREQQVTGIVETSTWYPASGAGQDCPPDPEGFVRWRKDKTVTPAAPAGDAQTLRSEYRYLTLPALDASQAPVWLGLRSETLVQVGSGDPELQRTAYDYINAPGDALRHGRVARETRSMNGLDTVTAYAYSKLTSPVFGESVLRTEQTLSGFDGEQKNITLEHSLFTGEPLLNRDDNDVEIRYRYDALRRVLKETVAPGTPWEAARQYQYQLCANEGEQAQQTRIDVKQVSTVSRFDGLNRVIYEERDDPDSAAADPPSGKALRQTYAAEYDALGNLISETEYDWLENQALPLTRQYEYDAWNQPLAVTGPDGVRSVEQTDPIGNEQSRGPIIRAWREGGGLRSGVTETWQNLFEQPARVERQDRAQQVLSLSQYQYDGLGRSVEDSTRVDGSVRRNRSRFDPFERLVASTLADDALVHRGYAAHSSEDLPVRISVEAGGNDVLLGEQQFDGLDRRVRAITGGREQRFSYAPGLFQPSSMTTASGQVVEYDYRPELGTDPLRRRLPGSVQADYEYDGQNALLLNCQEQNEYLKREYFSTHELKSETRRSADGAEYYMSYRYSRLGRLLGYTDVLGQQQICEYDPQGRLQLTLLGSTEARFEYDGLGRLAATLTSDSRSGQHLGVRLEYDDFDREILRVFDLNGTEQRMEQQWNEDDELRHRVLSEGAQLLRDETYEYDLRGRLTSYTCSGSLAPVDPYGKTIQSQVFRFDALDNITSVITAFDGGSNRATYRYQGQDPVQLSRVENNHVDYPTFIQFDYDPDGNLLRDEAARSLTYDALNRLTSVSGPAGGAYRYDPLDKLAGQNDDQRFYQGDQLATRLADGQTSSWLRGADTLLADAGKALLATDQNNSVLEEHSADARLSSTYTPYGHRYRRPPSEGGPALNGAFAEPATGWQLLGNGYRAFNPVLMRFHSPDGLSPFEEGGVNGYAYCEGDPLNETDPSGQGLLSWLRGRLGLKNRASTLKTVSKQDVANARMATTQSESDLRTAVIDEFFQGGNSTGAPERSYLKNRRDLQTAETQLGKKAITPTARKALQDKAKPRKAKSHSDLLAQEMGITSRGRTAYREHQTRSDPTRVARGGLDVLGPINKQSRRQT